MRTDCDLNEFYDVECIHNDIYLHNKFSILSDFNQRDDDSVSRDGDSLNDSYIIATENDYESCIGATDTNCNTDNCYDNALMFDCNGAIFSRLKGAAKKVNGFSIGHLNVRSLLPKIDQIKYILYNTQFDVLCLNETWLDDTIGQFEFDVDGYVTVNKPRNRHGGGVLIYVRKGIGFKRRHDLEPSDLECIWLQLHIHKKDILLCSMYRPPSKGSEYFDKMLDTIEVAGMEGKMIVIAGDLNINYCPDDSRNLLYYIECANNLSQLVSDYTRVTGTSKTIIDVILSSHPNLHSCTEVVKLALSDHYMVYTVIVNGAVNVNNQSHRELKYRCYKKFDETSFLNDIRHSNVFNEISMNTDINTTWKAWKVEFLRISDIHAPIRRSRVKNRYCPWINSEIIQLMYKRDYIHKLSTKNPSVDLLNQYKSLRDEVNVMIETCKKQYYDQLYNDGKTDTNALWKELKKLSGGTKTSNDTTNLTESDFNEFYASLGQNVTKNLPHVSDVLWKGPESVYDFKFNHVSEDNVAKLFRKLPLNSSLDVLNFDSKLLRIASTAIVKSFTHILNISISTGVLPDDWKIGRITPIYKGSGSFDEPVNYRPISVLGHIAKVVEKEIQCQLMSFLIEHQFISLDQFAYKQYHSTTSCLHSTIDEWLQNIEDRLCTGVCFLDISKCFDTIDHDLLLKKLRKYGVRNLEFLWFKDYLSRRSQCVHYNNKLSELTDVTIGVPQGSTLGPLLFVLFVNDLPMFIKNGRCSMYADDTIIHVSNVNTTEVNQELNDVLVNVENWYKANKLVLNVSKSNAMLISNTAGNESADDFSVYLNDNKLENVQCTKYLGVKVDNQLKFDIHVNDLVKRISAKLSWLNRLRRIVPKPMLVLTYKSYVQPIMEYACTVWGCSNVNINAIQRLQNRAARIICSNFDIVNVRGEDLVRELKWQTVSQRINYYLSTLMYSSIHGNAPDYLCNSITMACESNDVNTRLSNTLKVELPTCKTNVFKKSFVYRGSVMWNSLPSVVHESSSLSSFKNHVKGFL